MKLQRSSRLDLDKMGMRNGTEGRKGQKREDMEGKSRKLQAVPSKFGVLGKGARKAFGVLTKILS